MSLQELTALETAQAIENANYENVDVTYAVINEEDLLQVTTTWRHQPSPCAEIIVKQG